MPAVFVLVRAYCEIADTLSEAAPSGPEHRNAETQRCRDAETKRPFIPYWLGWFSPVVVRGG